MRSSRGTLGGGQDSGRGGWAGAAEGPEHSGKSKEAPPAEGEAGLSGSVFKGPGGPVLGMGSEAVHGPKVGV